MLIIVFLVLSSLCDLDAAWAAHPLGGRLLICRLGMVLTLISLNFWRIPYANAYIEHRLVLGNVYILITLLVIIIIIILLV